MSDFVAKFVMITILAREHNRVAAELAKMHPSWDNDKLYFEVTHMGQFPQDGENGQNVAVVYFLELCSDQFFKLFSTVLKSFHPLDSKNVFVLVLAHLEPELELFGR